MINTSAVTSGLVSELARAWDGLEVLTAIIKARGDSGDGAPVLHRLLEAACSSAPELRAAIWSARGGVLKPVAQLGSAVIDPSIEAMANATVRDGRTRLAGNQAGVGTMPLSRIQGIVTRGEAMSGARAVVALWGPAGSAPFDAHMTRIAEALAIQIALVFEEEDWTHRLLRQERSEADIEAARQVQQTLLESPHSGRNARIAWATLSRPARVVGGDFHDVGELPENGLGLILGDVMGKGLPAALIGAACLNHVLRAVAITMAMGQDGPGRILTQANRRLAPELRRLETFASMVVARVDVEHRRFHFADAGHGNILVRRREGRVDVLRGRETFVGVETDEFSEIVVPIEAGDMILVYTDGLPDLSRRRGETFDVPAWLGAAPATDPDALLAALDREIRRWCPDGEALDDDVTCLAVGVHA